VLDIEVCNCVKPALYGRTVKSSVSSALNLSRPDTLYLRIAYSEAVEPVLANRPPVRRLLGELVALASDSLSHLKS